MKQIRTNEASGFMIWQTPALSCNLIYKFLNNPTFQPNWVRYIKSQVQGENHHNSTCTTKSIFNCFIYMQQWWSCILPCGFLAEGTTSIEPLCWLRARCTRLYVGIKSQYIEEILKISHEMQLLCFNKTYIHIVHCSSCAQFQYGVFYSVWYNVR